MATPLDLYLSRELVANRYRIRHGLTANANKQKSMTTHISQGLEFFSSALNADITIKPLLQFYGVASLSRAVTIFLSPTQSEASLVEGHGLKTYGWGSKGSLSSGAGLSSIAVQVCRGLFRDLSKATNQTEYFRVNSSRVNWTVQFEQPKQGVVLKLGDLLGLVPDLWSDHTDWTHIEHIHFKMASVRKIKKDGRNQLEWIIKPSASNEQLKALFLMEVNDTADGVESESRFTIPASVDFQPVQLNSGPFGIGDVLLAPPIKKDLALNGMSVLYSVSFIMSMLARYRLTDWLEVWSGGKGDSARPLFQHFMEHLQDRFPQVCADIMNEKISINT